MAKAKKMPKRPKQSASLDTWKRYEQKVKDVKNHNDQLVRDKTAKKNLIAKISKMKVK